MNNEKRLRTIAVLLAAALIAGGAGAGVAVDRMFIAPDESTQQRRGPPRDLEDAVDRFRCALDLDDEQTEMVESIVARQWRDMGEVMRRFDPEMEAIRERTMTDIEELLRPEQKDRFDAMAERFERRRARMRHRLSLP